MFGGRLNWLQLKYYQSELSYYLDKSSILMLSLSDKNLPSWASTVFFRTTVGDNIDRIQRAIKAALGRADIVITTGGLGPTADDLTTECIAGVFAEPLIIDQAVLAHIESLFKSLKYKMPETNRKQALIPKGASVLPNPVGTACGIIWELNPPILQVANVFAGASEKVIMTFPGVPRELFSLCGKRLLSPIWLINILEAFFGLAT